MCPVSTATSPAAHPAGRVVVNEVVVAEPLFPEVASTYETATTPPEGQIIRG
jgi:hypothetical protein